AGDGLGHRLHLRAGDIAREVLALFPRLVVVVRPAGALAHDAEFAPLHLLDLGHLLQENLRGRWCFHGPKYIAIYIIKPEKKREFPFPAKFRLTPKTGGGLEKHLPTCGD